MDAEGWERFVEFVFAGVVLGVIEDLLAFYLATGGAMSITWRTIAVITLVAIPFAAFSELVIDD